ncbi:MAG TPA: sulfotransferase [Casimicrobiaceae bacterium]|nr:sulfotransferase [Casimicrobiaceae bacterium]
MTVAAPAHEPTGPPVFVLAGGGRTGSTLVQRLLISTGEIMIWGEHGGLLLDAVQRIVYGIRDWIDSAGGRQLAKFAQQGWNSFIPNLNPPHEAFLEGARAALRESLAVPAATLGYRRWGFKEIRYDAAAVSLLRTLFPDAAIVVLVRHPEAALRSIKATPWYEKDHDARPDVFLNRWATLSSSLAGTRSAGAGVLFLRYEELVADAEGVIAQLAAHVAVDQHRFNPLALTTRLRGITEELAPLQDRDRAALAAPAVRQAAAILGYDVERPAPN